MAQGVVTTFYQLTERLAAAESEIGTLKDQVLRVQAEAENVRRRAQRDVENAHKFALEKFCAELLPVIDSLEKAVDIARRRGRRRHGDCRGRGALPAHVPRGDGQGGHRAGQSGSASPSIRSATRPWRWCRIPMPSRIPSWT